MMSAGESDYRRLFRRTLIALAACATAVVFCYFKVDRAVAFWVNALPYEHAEPPSQFKSFLKALTDPPPIVQLWSPLVITLLIVWRAFLPYYKWQIVLFVACVSLIVADEFRNSLGELCGRYWPTTWFNNNPSLIGTNTYGFHPFQSGDEEGSFPSGHSARILGFATVWWIAMPRTRILLALVCVPMLGALILLNYHFVSDVIAGSFLGAIVAIYAARLADLRASVSRPNFDPLAT
jgi:membrane-associated phospholipid phosphatase